MFKIRNWIFLSVIVLSGITVLGSGIDVQSLYNKTSNELVQDFNNGLKKLEKIRIAF